jgi:hypothetical protein
MFLMIPQRTRVTELVETRLLCYRCGFEGHRTDLVKLPAVPRLPAAETNAYLDVRQPEGIWQSPDSPKPKGIGLLRKKKSVVGRRAKRGPEGSCCQSSILLPVLLADEQKKVVKLHKGSKEKLFLFM